MRILSQERSLLKKAKPGDQIAGNELTEAGAAQLNYYHYQVSDQQRPSVAELLVHSIFSGGLRRPANISPEQLAAAQRLSRDDKHTYPHRREWDLHAVNNWLAAKTVKKQDQP